MKIPLSWIKEFVEIPKSISAKDIEAGLVKVGFEVEAIDEQGLDLKGPLVLAQVKEIEELQGHKKPIRYVALDCGEKDIRYVICGATNFSVGDHVVAALPGAVLPGNFSISARETYGKTSNGMICSARELGISEEHSGIINLGSAPALKVGTNAIEALEIEDSIFDISINPDRGYAMSARGISREIALSLNLKFNDPKESVSVTDYEINNKGVPVEIQDKSGCSIINMRTIENFKADASVPIWMRRRLEKCGMRSISLAVDITNYVMLELGQPLHAFDAEKVSGKISVRRAKDGEKLKTLDGVERKLHASDLVIADEKQSLALAGTMGGEFSEVTSQTKRIALEAARFNPQAIAQNSRKHILTSEASRRLERGVDGTIANYASARAVDLLVRFGSASYVGGYIDGTEVKPSNVTIETKKISNLLGLEVSAAKVKELIEKIGCKVSGNGDSLEVEPPTWRFDLTHFSDFAEEVARQIGYDQIPLTLPTGQSGASLTDFQRRKRFVASYLAGAGFSETYNSPFINQNYLESLGFSGDRAKTFKIINPMSEEFPVLRTHLLPGLFLTAQRNLGRGAKNVSIFEIGSLFRNTTKLSSAGDISTSQRPSANQIKAIYESVPKQPVMMAGLVAGKLVADSWEGKGTDFNWNDSIQLVKNLISEMVDDFEIVESDFAPWHPGRCAEFRVAGKPVAHAGEIHPRVLSNLNLPARSCAFGILISEIPYRSTRKTSAVSPMTPVIQDLAFIVSKDLPNSELEAVIRNSAGPLLEDLQLFDRYDKIEGGKVSLAYTLTFRANDRTLTSEEVSEIREQIAREVKQKIGGELRA